jgi:ComF family protein
MRGARQVQVGVVAQYSNALEACQPSLFRQVYGASKSLIHRLFPATCLLCLEAGQPPFLDLCRECEADMPRNAPACPACAMPLGAAGSDCTGCKSRRAAFDAAFVPYRYEFPLVELIHRLKYGNQIAIARILGMVLAHRLLERGRPAVDAIVPVPLHHAREARRGYNQAGEIARFAAELVGLPVIDHAALRVRATEEQAALLAVVRRVNVSGAFEAIPGSLPAAVAIVDDVMTTGSTVDALAQALKRAGCRRVEAWAIARA